MSHDPSIRYQSEILQINEELKNENLSEEQRAFLKEKRRIAQIQINHVERMKKNGIKF